MQFDLIVIGTGPAGEKAAVKAAYFGHKVAIVEKEKSLGGAETLTGTLPSKTLKETALFLSGNHERDLYGVNRDLERKISVEDFLYRKNVVQRACSKEIKENLLRHKVTIFHGEASFIDSHTLLITGEKKQKISAKYILIASGSYPYHPENIPFDTQRILDSNTILNIKKFPKSLAIVGGGVIGCEYTTIFATMGIKVFLIHDKEEILPHIDREIGEHLILQMKIAGVKIFSKKQVLHIKKPKKAKDPLCITLNDKKTLEADMFLFASGRSGNIAGLHVERAGIKTGKRETILVDKNYRTSVPHIYAVGDVVGFPALASTSMEQGRIAISNIFKTKDLDTLPACFPLGVYTIPEISAVGLSEEEALEKKIPYLCGKARYPDMPRGMIMGVSCGFLKLVFDKKSLQILGVHIIGPIASEIIHYGATLVDHKKTLWDIVSQVFNFPTLHDLYKYAAYDGLSLISGKKIKP